MKDSDIDVLRSLTRLLVGASLIGIDQLREQVARWETATLEALTPPADDATDVSNPTELANQNVSDASWWMNGSHRLNHLRLNLSMH
ncbi:MAG: hypothetical protein HC837_02200 [Chloroflexaceae bacterium]|nr:hypothetical protein [Chloroflexaceae bacterium]